MPGQGCLRGKISCFKQELREKGGNDETRAARWICSKERERGEAACDMARLDYKIARPTDLGRSSISTTASSMGEWDLLWE